MLNDAINKKLAELMGKMDEKVLKARINSALEMLQKGNTEDLVKKLENVDKKELLEKLDQLDEQKLKDLNINRNEMNSKIKASDMDKLSSMLGDEGKDLVDKIKALLKK